MTSNLFFLSVFLAGILSFFSPCILPLMPVYAGVLLDGEDGRKWRLGRLEVGRQGLLKTLAFIAGLSLIFLILGYGAGFLGDILYAAWFRYVMGGIVILLGIHQMEIINLTGLQKEKRLHLQAKKERNAYLQSFLLGLTFSFGWTPCVGPVLGSVLALAASGGNGAWQGALLMLVYTVGLALPFLALALASNLVLEKFSNIKPYMGLLKKIGGFLIILMGILLMLGNLNILATIFE